MDRQYYSATETGLLHDAVHRIRIGAKQAIMRPGLLLDVVRTRKLRALWIPDRRRILIDSTLPAAKHRWNEAHEIGHSLIPWHAEVAHGDHQLTLRMECEQEIEAEANYAAARMLFLRDRFERELRDGRINLTRVRALAKTFGNTITSTLWRTVETMDVPSFALVSQHPRKVEPDSSRPLVEHYIALPGFRAMFPTVTGDEIFFGVRDFCGNRRRGPLGSGEILLRDAMGEEQVFFAECFCNGYSALSLGIHQGPRKLMFGTR